jgi:hypothetical protein
MRLIDHENKKRFFVNYKKRYTRLAAAKDKVYQLLAHGQWFSPGTPASSLISTFIIITGSIPLLVNY